MHMVKENHCVTMVKFMINHLADGLSPDIIQTFLPTQVLVELSRSSHYQQKLKYTKYILV